MTYMDFGPEKIHVNGMYKITRIDRKPRRYHLLRLAPIFTSPGADRFNTSSGEDASCLNSSKIAGESDGGALLDDREGLGEWRGVEDSEDELEEEDRVMLESDKLDDKGGCRCVCIWV